MGSRLPALKFLLSALVALLLLPAFAQAADRDFALRFSANTTGDVRLVGNTLLTCPPGVAECAAARAGTGTLLNNNNFAMVNVDVDSDSTTFNSSTARAALPTGATVLFAGLYYGARTTAGGSGTAAPNRNARGTVRLRGPGDSSYATVTAAVDDSTLDTTNGGYAAFADVTQFVSARGAGDYTVANVQAGTGVDRYAGWSLVIVVRDPAEAARNLAVFDGLNVISTANSSDTISVSGFQTPSGGSVAARLGLITYEGDLGSTGDTVRLNGSPISDALNPASNVFNSSLTRLGTRMTAKNPDYVNQLGYDSDVFGTSGIITPGSTSATIALTTSSETYIPQVVTSAIDLQQPVVTLSKSVVNLDNGTAGDRRGDRLRYTVTATNTGFDAADATVVRDAIPAGTDYITGSLRQTAGSPSVAARTDASGDDAAEFDSPGGQVVFRVGTGATATAGGRLAATGQAGNTATVQFDVRIRSDAPPRRPITNTATSTDRGATLGNSASRSSDAVSSVVAAPDLTLAKTAVGTLTGGEDATYTLSATNSGNFTTDGSTVTVVDELDPAAFTSVTSAAGTGWTCAVSGLRVTCTRTGALAAGASAPDITLRARLRAASPASVTNTATISGATLADADTTNNGASDTSPTVRRADLSITKAVGATPTIGRPTTFTLAVRNDGPSTAPAVKVNDALGSGYTDVTATSTVGTCTTTVICDLGDLAPGATGTITIRATPTGEGGPRANTATISSAATDPTAANDSATALFVVGASADLQLAKTATPTTASVGEEVRFRLTIRNAGPNAATNVVLTDTLPAGLTFIRADARCSAQAPVLTCTVGALASGASDTVDVFARPALSAQGQRRTNVATARSDADDPATADNTASAFVDVRPAADLTITKTASDGTPAVGAPVTFTLTVANDGPAAATGVVLRDELPAGLAFERADGCTTSGGVVTCAIGALAAGTRATRTIVVRPTSAVSADPVTNAATVDGDQDDPDATDDRATATITVDPLADLAATLSLSPSAADVGQAVTATLRATNDGPDAATGAVLELQLPAGVVPEGLPAGCTFDTTTRRVRCLVGTVAAQATVTRSFTVRAGAETAGTTVRPVLRVSSDVADPDPADDTDTRALAVDQLANLALTKDAGPLDPPGVVLPGGRATFTLRVDNAGPNAATGVVVRDDLPDDLTFNAAASDSACTAVGRLVTCTYPSIPSGGSFTRSVVVDVGIAASGQRRTNSATVDGDQDDQTPADDTSSASVTVGLAAGYSITKTASPGAPAVGETVTYTLTARNPGPAPALNTVLTDVLPAGLEFISADTGCTYDAPTRTVRCAIGTLLIALPQARQIRVRPTAAAAGKRVTNTAQIASSTPDLLTADNTDSAAVDVAPLADLGIVKRGPASVAAGAEATFTLTVTNAGPNPATGVRISDPLPSGLTFVSAAGCQATGQDVTCDIGTLAAGAEAVRTIVTRAAPSAAGGSRTNTATVRGAQDDQTPANDSSSAQVDVTAVADISLTKEGPAAPVAVGAEGSFSLTARNAGPNAAVGVRIRDVVPDGLRIVRATGCDVGLQVVTCALGTLEADGAAATAARTIVVSPTRELSGQTLTNVATLDATTADPDDADRRATATLTVRPTTNLRALATVTDPAPAAGATTTLRVGVRNDGPLPATGVTVTTVLPEGVTLVDDAGCTVAGRTVTCTIPGSIAVGQTVQRDLVIRTTAAAAGKSLSATTTVRGAQDDDVPADDSATASFGVGALADLRLAVTASAATVSVGEELTFTLRATNDGPNAAVGASVGDELPEGFELVRASDRCTTSGRTVTCQLGAVGAGETATASVVVRATNALAGRDVTNTAQVRSATADPTAANNGASATVSVRQRAELSLTKTVSPTSVRPGQTATFTLTARNAGPSTATAVTIVDTLPADLTPGAVADGCAVSGRVVTCTRASLPAGQQATFTVEVTASLAAAGQDRRNTARVDAEQEDQGTADDVASATLSVEDTADLALRKDVAPASIETGDEATFTLTARNRGPSTARDVVVRDEIPAGLDVSAVGDDCRADGRLVVCRVSAIAADADRAFTIRVRATEAASGSSPTNTATLAAATFDPTTDDLRASATLEVAALADLTLSARFDPASASVGQTVGLRLQAGNEGPVTARAVTITHVLPAGLEVVSLPDGCTLAARTVTCTVGDLAPGAQALRVLQLRATAAVAGSDVRVTARADSPTSERDPADDTDAATLTVRPLADLSTTVTVDPATPRVGEDTAVRLTVANGGPSRATAAEARLQIPAGFSVVDPGDGCEVAGDVVLCTVGDLAAGSSASRTVVLRPTAAVAGREVTLSARATSPTDDRDATNDAGSTTVRVGALADLAATISASPTRIDVGETTTFTLSVRNLGPTAATGVVLEDDLPTGLEPAGTLPAGCTVQGQRVRCVIGDLANGATASVQLTARATLAGSGDQLVNTLRVRSGVDDPSAANDTATATVDVDPIADLRVTKVVDDPAPRIGQTVTFTVSATNDGPERATGAELVDRLPDDLELAGAIPEGCTLTARVLRCDVGILAVDETVSRKVALVVGAGAADQRRVNVATVEAREDDQTPDDDQASAEVRVGTLAGVSVTSSAIPLAPGVGDDVRLTVTARNDGPNPAQAVVVTTTVPEGLDVVADQLPAGCTLSGRTITCQAGTLAASGPGATRAFELVLRPSLAGAGRSLTVASEVATATQTPDDGDRRSEAVVQVDPAADLALTKTASASAPRVGDDVTYTLTVANQGPNAATGILLTDVLPAGVAFRSASDGCDAGDGVVECRIAGLASGSSATRTIVVRVEAAAGGARQTNTATVRGAEDDLDPADNRATATTDAASVADLGLAKSVSPASVAVGGEATFTLLATNRGPNAATDVRLRDVLPDGLELVRASQGCEATAAEPRTVVCTIPRLEASGPGATAEREIVVRPTREVSGDPVTNVASIRGAEPDPRAVDDRDDAVLAVRALTDLRATKEASAPRIAVGDLVTYTLGAGNAGPDDATGVELRDTLPAGLAFVDSETGCEDRGGEVVCAVGALPVGRLVTRTFRARALPSAGGATPVNRVSVRGDQDDQAPANDSARTEVQVDPLADLSVSFGASPARVAVGEPVELQGVVRNAGPNTATAATVTVPIPAGLEVRETSRACGFDTDARIVTCLVGDLASGGSATFSITVAALPTAAGADSRQVLAATATSGTRDPALPDNTDDAAFSVDALAELSITKLADEPSVEVGEDATFTLTARNAGPSAATGVTVTDLLPAGLELRSATGCVQGTDGELTCAVGNLAVNATRSFTVVARADASAAGQRRTNDATVRGDQDDQQAGDDEAQAAVAVGDQAGLALTTRAVPQRASVGETVRLELTAENAGPTAATGVRLELPIPTGVRLSAVPDGCTYDQATRVLRCVLGTIAVDAQRTVTVLLVPEAEAAGTALRLEPALASDTPDPQPQDDSAIVRVEVAPQADLALTKTASTATPASGDEFTYLLNVVNGPRTATLSSNRATGVVITDDLPAGVELVSMTPDCERDGRRLSCSVGALEPGADASVTVRVKALAAFAGRLQTNSAAVSGDQEDPGARNDTATASTTTQARADLSVALRAEPGAVAPGAAARLVARIENAGPNASTAVVLTTVLPEGVTFVSAPDGCTYAAEQRTVTCAVGTLEAAGAGSTAERTIVVQPVRGSAGQTLVARASVDAATEDPDPTDDAASTELAIGSLADLSLTKVADKTSANPGEEVTFRLTAANDGPNAATGVVIRDVLPAGLVPTTAADCAVDGQAVTCTVGPLASQGSAERRITARVDRTVAGSSVTNTATVDATQPDPDEADRSASATVAVGAIVDLRMTGTSAPDAVSPGRPLTVTFTVQNADGPAATGVLLTTTLPTGVTLDRVPEGCTYDAPTRTLTCRRASVAAGATTSFAVELTPDASVAGTTLRFPATVRADQAEATPGQEAVTVEVPVRNRADLALTKTADRDDAAVGDVVRYTLRVTNQSTQPAREVSIVDVLPDGLALDATPQGCTVDGRTVTCPIGDLAAGASATKTLTTTVTRAGAGSTVANVANVSATGSDDPAPADNRAQDTVRVAPLVDLDVTKTAADRTPAAGATVRFDLAVRNTGPNDATGVVLTDELPAGLTLVSATPSQGTCAAATCTIGRLAAGERATVALVARVAADAAGRTLRNVARARAEQADAAAANDAAAAEVSVPAATPTPTPDPTPTPTPDPGPAAPPTPTPPATPTTPQPAPVVPAPAPPAQVSAFAACSGGRLKLIEVDRRGDRTYLFGVAGPQSVGKPVALRSLLDGKVVARPVVGADRTFTALVPLPPKAFQTSNRTRYVAELGKERSLALKFARRMSGTVARRLSPARVRLSGRVTKPLARPIARVQVRGTAACGAGAFRGPVIARNIRVRADGSWSTSITLPAALRKGRLFLRAETRVRANTRSPKTNATFTLVKDATG